MVIGYLGLGDFSFLVVDPINLRAEDQDGFVFYAGDGFCEESMGQAGESARLDAWAYDEELAAAEG